MIGTTFHDLGFVMFLPAGIHQGVSAGGTRENNKEAYAEQFEDDQKDWPVGSKIFKPFQLIDGESGNHQQTGKGVTFTRGVGASVEVREAQDPDSGTGEEEEAGDNEGSADDGLSLIHI